MIKPLLWGLFFLILVLLLQTTLWNVTALWGVKADLVLILFFFLAVHNNVIPSTLMGFITGLTLDFMTGGIPGFHAFIFTLAGYILGHWKGKIFFDPLAIPLLMAAFATFYNNLAQFLLSALFHLGQTFSDYFNFSFLIALILNLIAAPLIWAVFHAIRQRALRSRRGGFDVEN